MNSFIDSKCITVNWKFNFSIKYFQWSARQYFLKCDEKHAEDNCVEVELDKHYCNFVIFHIGSKIWAERRDSSTTRKLLRKKLIYEHRGKAELGHKFGLDSWKQRLWKTFETMIRDVIDAHRNTCSKRHKYLPQSYILEKLICQSCLLRLRHLANQCLRD